MFAFKFQFLIGTIKTNRRRKKNKITGKVSIPYRYYKNCFRQNQD